jgi:ABC-2 type transport system permease protein
LSKPTSTAANPYQAPPSTETARDRELAVELRHAHAPLIQPVLWRLAWREQRVLLLSLVSLLLVFGVVYVWLVSRVKLEGLLSSLLSTFKDFEALSGVPFKDVATISGRIALGFIDPVVLLTMTTWAISRGSDLVSGELDRGTLELTLAQPIRRMSFLLAKVALGLVGVVVLALAFWIGISLGILLVHAPDEQVSGWEFWPGVLNIMLLGVMILGVSCAMSSWDRYRWRTVGIMGGCYATWLLFKILYKMGGAPWSWIGWLTPFRWFEPQLLIREVGDWSLQLGYNAMLLLIGMTGYVISAVVFTKRDLPAPL